MAFQHGLSGLNAASKGIDAVGNNIANSSTVGFKTSSAAFADVYAAITGSSNLQIGIGTTVGAVNQLFTQGNITVTSNPLDLAINGQGFFRLSNNGEITWTRNGQFQLDKDGYIVDMAGRRLTGYLANTQNVVVPSTPAEIFINMADLTPQATGSSIAQTGLEIGLNLDSRMPPITAAFDANNPNTYTSSTSATVYDSLGNAHLLSIYFVKTATPNQWSVYTTLNGDAASTSGPATLTFTTSGALDTTIAGNGLIPQSFALTTGATTPLEFDLNFAGSTQFGSLFGVNSVKQDGYPSGRLSGLSVAPDGMILGRYTNGQSRTLAQVVLGNFNNPNGLISLGGNQWAESSESGQPLVGAPGSGTLGVLQSAAIEESNVDLTKELVDMIVLQRMYQANAQTIKTQDAILQTLVNLR